jgi:hypothetical protein
MANVQLAEIQEPRGKRVATEVSDPRDSAAKVGTRVLFFGQLTLTREPLRKTIA